MEKHDENVGRKASQSKKKRKKERDTTPSFIRNVQSRAELLNPQRQNGDVIPVLTMPRSVKVWRTIRWPLAVLIIIVVLATVGLITNDMLISRSVERTVAETQSAERQGAIDQIQAAGKTLSALAERQPNRANAQVAWAWQAILQSVILGPENELIQKARVALDLTGDDASSVGWAARAGFKYVEGNPDEALETATKGLGKHPNEPRLKLVHAWALNGIGKTDDARNVLLAEIESSNTYIPFIISLIALEIETGNRMAALALAEKLLTVSPGHLYGSLITVSLALPGFWSAGLDTERVAVLMNDIDTLKPLIDSAPPKLAVLGNYLYGRINLLAGRLEKAENTLGKIVNQSSNPEILAWYAAAVQRLRGPDAALAALDKYPDTIGPEILDIRARCLLAFHRVDAATPVIKKMEAFGALSKRTRELLWMLAVRSGDRKRAVALMPDKISADNHPFAVELYFSLKNDGDSSKINKLTGAMDAELSACAAAIRVWHKNGPRRAFRALTVGDEKKDFCVDSLALKLLKGHVKPPELKKITERLEEAPELNLRVEVFRAMADWLIEDRETAVKKLNEIWKLKPEGVPLKYALGQSYFEIGMPETTLEILEGVDDPDAIAKTIFAARAAGRKDMASKLIEIAITRNAETPHPAFAYFNIEKRINDGSIHDVFKEIVPLLSTAGHWTTEIAKQAVEALSSKGNRTVADRLLYQTSREVCRRSGLDEAWDARLAQAHFNLRRGGRSLYRSLYIISTLKEEGVRDPRVSYNFALANIKDGNDRMGIRSLREALQLDPTFKPAYEQLISMQKADDEILSWMKRAWPELGSLSK